MVKYTRIHAFTLLQKPGIAPGFGFSVTSAVHRLSRQRLMRVRGRPERFEPVGSRERRSARPFPLSSEAFLPC